MRADRKVTPAVKKLAAIEFEPWPPEDVRGLMEELSNPRYQRYMDRIGIDLRIVSGVLKNSKAHLVKEVPVLGDEVYELVDSLNATAERLRQLAVYVDDGHRRMMVALAYAAVEELKQPT